MQSCSTAIAAEPGAGQDLPTFQMDQELFVDAYANAAVAAVVVAWVGGYNFAVVAVAAVEAETSCDAPAGSFLGAAAFAVASGKCVADAESEAAAEAVVEPPHLGAWDAYVVVVAAVVASPCADEQQPEVKE